MNHIINKKIQLGKIVTIHSGYSPKSCTLTKKGLLPYVKVEDMNNCNKYQEHSRFYTNDVKKSIPSGAVIFPKRGAAIMKNKVRITNRAMCIDTNMMALVVNEKVLDNEYLFNVLLHKQLFKIMDISIIPQINNKHIDLYTIPLPPIGNQKKIVNLISQWDKAIEASKSLIAAKEQQFDWLLTRLLNAQHQYLQKLGDHFGKDIIIEKGKHLVKSDVSEGNIPVIAGGQTSPYRHSKYTHSIPCITISSSGAYAGFVWYHSYPIWASDCNVIYSENHLTRYLYFALNARQEKIYTLQSGGGQPHVYAKDIKNLTIPLPPLHEQIRIAEILNTSKQEISLLKTLTKQYGIQKKGLMQKLLSDEWYRKNNEEA